MQNLSSNDLDRKNYSGMPAKTKTEFEDFSKNVDSYNKDLKYEAAESETSSINPEKLVD